MGQSKLRVQSVGLLSMLGIQFILGMALNTFVGLPKNHSGTTGGFVSRGIHGFGWAISAAGGVVLFFHVIVAIGLLLGSLGLVARAIAVKSRPWVVASTVGAFSIIVALTNGLAFIGYNKDANSFVMAMGFLAATTSYSVILARAPALNATKKRQSISSKSHATKGFSSRVRHSHS